MSERGFTLVETIITIGILVMLLVAGGAWMFGSRPGALVSAVDEYDASLAAARALSLSGGNGATLVFAPRSNGAAGFELRVYAGRPTAANAVQATTTMPVIADASVSEASLGDPPFALFLGASGDVSGKASYPKIDTSGGATFATIAKEPACPAGGFTLTFTSPQGAKAVRTLPCLAAASAATAAPNPSPTPNVPLVTPASLVYHWPAAPEQQFVATEWGYTHWFATTSRFACASAARYPNVLPSPYSAAPSGAEADASPPPPSDTPYSYPNSNGGSTNDAPAAFPLDPAAAGTCEATVEDDFKQTAQAAVDVMGWLTVAYGGKSYTHQSSSTLSIPASAFAQVGATVTLGVSKTYDAEALAPQVDLDATCARYLSATAARGTTPKAPSSTAAAASVTLTLIGWPSSSITCGGTIYDQYDGSESGEGVPFGAALQRPSPQTWPPAVEYPMPGSSLGPCATDQPRAYNAKFTAVLKNVLATYGGQGADGPYGADSNGCLVYNATQVGSGMVYGTAVNDQKTTAVGVSILVNEPGYSDELFLSNDNVTTKCNEKSISFNGQGNDAQSGPTGNFVAAPQAAESPCQVAGLDRVESAAGTSYTPESQQIVAVQVAASPTPAPCSTTCFAEVTGRWTTYSQCVGGDASENCPIDHYADDVFISKDGGASWTLWQRRDAGKQCEAGPYNAGFTSDTYIGSLLDAPNDWTVTWSGGSGPFAGYAGADDSPCTIGQA